MVHRIVKIYNTNDFKQITRGIRVARCMRVKSYQDTEKIVNNLEDLTVSESLSCSFCNTYFKNKVQQRLHYKLDWHTFNLKQHLRGLQSIPEASFNCLVAKDSVYTIFESETNPENEISCIIEKNSSFDEYVKLMDLKSKNNSADIKLTTKNSNKNAKISGMRSESSDDEFIEKLSSDSKDDILSAIASRHSKVFFENEEGSIFSIYRCLLHNKKEVPEIDSEIITQALKSGNKHVWTIIMIGGGHFAAAVFSDAIPIVHKTIHSYTVRAKQGSLQSTRDKHSSSHLKSAGANIRRYNEANFVQNVQQILESWSNYIVDSALILYRAVGSSNRFVLFGGKNAVFNKNDPRLRPLPFPTRRATFSEVKRVFDILSSIEIYGSAAEFVDCFPISPRQPIRKKMTKSNDAYVNGFAITSEDQKKRCSEKRIKNTITKIDRAKSRKSPQRPLPDIVAKLAQPSSESEFDIQESLEADFETIDVIKKYETFLKNNLKTFENAAPRYRREKKLLKQKFRKNPNDVI